MLREVTVLETVVSITMPTEHCYWNGKSPVIAASCSLLKPFCKPYGLWITGNNLVDVIDNLKVITGGSN